MRNLTNRNLPSSAYALLILLLLAGCAQRGPRANSTSTTPVNVQLPEDGTTMLAVYQPWFGNTGHINVGYSSHDSNVLREQIARAQEMNISGFVVNWYGPGKEWNDRTYDLLQKAAAADGTFKVAAQYDEPPGYSTDTVLVDLQYLYDRYISAASAGPSRSAYLRYKGRPVVFIFPKDALTDWNRVREMTQAWPDPPLLIYKDQNDKYDNAFDGYYPWVHAGKAGWSPDGNGFGEDYLEYFYNNMTKHHPDKIAVGGVWPGFNDSKASWGRGRRMDYRCGQTFADTLKIFRHYYGTQNPAPFLLVETWNDYEEGTDVERGFSHCTNRAAGLP